MPDTPKKEASDVGDGMNPSERKALPESLNLGNGGYLDLRNLIDLNEPTQSQFCTELKTRGIPYEINDGIVIVDGYSLHLPNLTSLPKGVHFSGRGCVSLPGLTSISEATRFTNSGDVYLPSLTSMSGFIYFKNKGGVYLSGLTSMSGLVTFRNWGNVYLSSLISASRSVTFDNRGELILRDDFWGRK